MWASYRGYLSEEVVGKSVYTDPFKQIPLDLNFPDNFISFIT